MAEINNVIAGASQDLQTIEDFVNLPADSEVYPRLLPSVNVGTLAGARQAIFEAGGLPATPFSTKALMTASALVDGDYAMVTNDTVNNGLYVKTAGAWVKSAYDPQAAAIARSSESLAKVVETNISEDVLVVVDANDKVVAHINANGDLFLTGIQSSLQSEMQSLDPKKYIDNDSAEGVLSIIDAAGNSVVYIDNDGHVHLVGLEQSLQDILQNLSIGGGKSDGYSNPLPDMLTSADTYPDKISSRLAYVNSVSGVAFPEPLNLLPQNYSINTDWVKGLTLIHPASYVPMDAFQDAGTATNWMVDTEVVHPHVVELKKPMLGYKYWMAITPYVNSSENYELPYVYGTNSDELTGWQLIEGLPKPFDVDPVIGADESLANSGDFTSGHLSDPAFTYNPSTGELWLIWRRSLYYDGGRSKDTAKSSLWGRKTLDGVTWSDKLPIVNEYTGGNQSMVTSPAIVYSDKDDCFYLYTIASDARIVLQKSKNLGTGEWSSMVVVVTATGDFSPYHLEARCLGDSIVLFVNDYLNRKNCFYTSKDGVTFTKGANLLEGIDTYKGSFLPIFKKQGQMAIKVIYTSGARDAEKWKLYVAETNNVNIGA